MVTVAKKKVSAKTKVEVVPAKVIATAAKKAPSSVTAKAVKTVSKPAAAVSAKTAPKKLVAKPSAAATKKTPVKPVVKSVTKSATKSANKPTNKVASKSATKSAVKVESKVKPVAPKVEKLKKPKLVRDSFTMPEAEYAVLGDVKKACLAAGVEVKKSQLLRIGLELLKKTEMAQLKAMITALPALKAGRPKLAK